MKETELNNHNGSRLEKTENLGKKIMNPLQKSELPSPGTISNQESNELVKNPPSNHESKMDNPNSKDSMSENTTTSQIPSKFEINKPQKYEENAAQGQINVQEISKSDQLEMNPLDKKEMDNPKTKDLQFGPTTIIQIDKPQKLEGNIGKETHDLSKVKQDKEQDTNSHKVGNSIERETNPISEQESKMDNNNPSQFGSTKVYEKVLNIPPNQPYKLEDKSSPAREQSSKLLHEKPQGFKKQEYIKIFTEVEISKTPAVRPIIPKGGNVDTMKPDTISNFRPGNSEKENLPKKKKPGKIKIILTFQSLSQLSEYCNFELT